VVGERRFIHVAYLEGLASVGKIARFWVEDCRYPGFRKIVAETTDGEILETKCIDWRGAKKVILYIQYAKNMAKLMVEGESVGNKESL
jgi:hypothetical protein